MLRGFSEQEFEGAVEVFDTAGRRVAELFRGRIPEGSFSLDLELPAYAAAGVYFVDLRVNGSAIARSSVIVLR
jgi:hypothetical protein